MIDLHGQISMGFLKKRRFTEERDRKWGIENRNRFGGCCVAGAYEF